MNDACFPTQRVFVQVGSSRSKLWHRRCLIWLLGYINSSSMRISGRAAAAGATLGCCEAWPHRMSPLLTLLGGIIGAMP